MISGLITSWQVERKWVEVVTDFLFLGSKFTVDGDWSHEIKRRLLLGRKAMTSLDSVMEGRDITLLTKVCIVKAMVFPVVMYGCDSWTVKKAERWIIDAFKWWCWRRLPRVPWTVRSSQLILRKTNPGYLLEGLMVKLKLQHFGHLMQTAHLKSPWCWERLKAEGEEGIRGWDDWMASLKQWTWTWANFGRWWGTERPAVLQSMGSRRFRHNSVTKQQQ